MRCVSCGLIDVHHHIIPPFYLDENRERIAGSRGGKISPAWLAVLALKFLQKSMMFTPCGPSAVPTGGAGVALPAEICNFTIA